MSSPIPRFLLPQRSSIWLSRTYPSRKLTPQVRNASHKPAPKSSSNPSKPKVLEKPARFNPPSHGARLPRNAPRYSGPPLSAEQKMAQNAKKYPNMMPPKGTFMHWFLNSRSIHVYITLGTLFSLAGYTAIVSFKKTSPFASMLPNASDLFFHPIAFTRTCLEVLRLHSAARSAETAERRKQNVDDVQKRSAFRKAHGLETEGIGGWTAKEDSEALGPAILDGTGSSPPAVAAEEEQIAERVDAVKRERRPVKKWLGIW